MKKLLLTTILILFFAGSAQAGTAHYADLNDGGSSNLGTYAEPFNSIATINAHSFSTGDDLYFKQNTTQSIGTSYLDIDWSGTSGDHAVIGCYEAEGDFDCSGTIPILIRSDNSNYVVRANSQQYIDIEYVDIREGHISIYANGTDNSTISYCNIGKGATQYGIMLENSDSNTISNNTIDTDIAVEGQVPYDDGGILWDGIQIASGSTSNIVNNNTIIDWGHSGINFQGSDYNKAYNNYVSGFNTSYMRGFEIQAGADHNEMYNNWFDHCPTQNQILGTSGNPTTYNEVIYNIINDTSVAVAGKPGSGIQILTTGGNVSNNIISNNVFYNLTGASEGHGITLENYTGTPVTATISSNTIANNIVHTWKAGSYGIYINSYASGVSNNIIKNNILYKSGVTDVTYVFIGSFSCGDGACTNTEFNALSSNYADNITDDPDMNDPANDLYYLDSDSPCINQGIDLGNETNYANGWNPSTSMPPATVSTLDQDDYGAGWEIGAYVYSTGGQTSGFITPSNINSGNLSISNINSGNLSITVNP